MRGGTSKGVFFNSADLPVDPQQRDAMLLRAIGSPDPYEKHSDGMGGATSSTSKVVVLSKSQKPGYDVDYLFGAVAIGEPLIDWSGNCGNLSAAVGPAAIHMGLTPVPNRVDAGIVQVHIWQANIGQHIVAHVPVANGVPQDTGEFREDGVAFNCAEIVLEFIEEDNSKIALLPTGNVIDILDVLGVGRIEATLLTAGNPTIFIDAATLGLLGTELQDGVNADTVLLAQCEAIRAHAAVMMELATDAASATRDRPATPKLAWIAPAADYVTSAGARIGAHEIDVLARILSMGKLHHAFTGTGAIALAVAAVLPGSIVARNMQPPFGAQAHQSVRFGHVSGRLTIGATVRQGADGWQMDKAILSRSARVIMSGWVHVPSPFKVSKFPKVTIDKGEKQCS